MTLLETPQPYILAKPINAGRNIHKRRTLRLQFQSPATREDQERPRRIDVGSCSHAQPNALQSNTRPHRVSVLRPTQKKQNDESTHDATSHAGEDGYRILQGPRMQDGDTYSSMESRPLMRLAARHQDSFCLASRRDTCPNLVSTDQASSATVPLQPLSPRGCRTIAHQILGCARHRK